MQQCFQEHPEHYKDFLTETEEARAGEAAKAEEAAAAAEEAKKEQEWHLWSFAK